MNGELNGEAIDRLIRAYCEKAPDGNNPTHRRVVTVNEFDGMERETCRWCGDVKEHPPVVFGDMPDMGEPDSRLPAVPKGFQLIE